MVVANGGSNDRCNEAHCLSYFVGVENMPIDTIIDIFYKDDGRANFTEATHPRKPDGHFSPTPVGTHYEAKHKHKSSHKRSRVLTRKRRRSLKNATEQQVT